MVFNGHTLENIRQIDENTMGHIITMYADGLLGNSKVLTLLSQLTAGVFNYMRPANSKDYKLDEILGSAHDYIFPPISTEEQKKITNNALKAFVMSAPGFNKTLMGNKNG
jgi:hypothetical protein